MGFFLTDAQRSTIALADGDTGTVDADHNFTYNAFGELQDDPAPTSLGTKYLYTGQYFDAFNTELYNLRARQYNPTNGRFLSRDKWAYNYNNPFELNRYVYTANNPTMYTDPSGYQGTLSYGAASVTAGVASVILAGTFAKQFLGTPQMSSSQSLSYVSNFNFGAQFNFLIWVLSVPSVYLASHISGSGARTATPEEVEREGLGGIGVIPDDFDYAVGEAVQAWLDQLNAGQFDDLDFEPEPNPWRRREPWTWPWRFGPDEEETEKPIVLSLGPSTNIEGEIMPLINHYRGIAKVVAVESDSDNAFLLRVLLSSEIEMGNFDVIQGNFGSRSLFDNTPYQGQCAIGAFSLYPNIFGASSLVSAVNNHVCSGGISPVYIVSEDQSRSQTIMNNLSSTVTFNPNGSASRVSTRCIANPNTSSCAETYGVFSPGIGFSSDGGYANNTHAYVLYGTKN